MTSLLKRLLTGVVACGLAACGGADGDAGEHSLRVPENVRLWANTASALAVYALVYEPFAFADGEAGFDDPACPVTSDDGTTVVISGGCVDDTGRHWTGRATIERLAEGDRTLVLEAYGSYDDLRSVATLGGSVALRRAAENVHEFDASLVHEGGVTTTIEYSGSVEGGYTGPTLWNGGGTVTRSGDFPPIGTVAASTLNQLVDGAVCSGQAVSGQTTLEDGPLLAVVEYDGAMDCDDQQAARWSVDGEERGLLTGVTCRVAPAGPGGRGPSGPALALLAGAIAGLVRRASAIRRRSRLGHGAAREHR